MENQDISHEEDAVKPTGEEIDEQELSSDNEDADDDDDDEAETDSELASEYDGEEEEDDAEGDEEGDTDDDEEEGDEDASDDEEEDDEAVAEAGDEEAGISSGDETSERCPICLNCLREQDIGMPEACDHLFCLECIQEWSKNVNTCPVDRQVFNIILAKHAGEEKVYRQIPVENRQQLQEEEEAAAVHDETVCEVCGLADREDRLLLCDSCDAGYHCDCLDPPLARVPVHEWFCPDCMPQRNTVEEEPQQHGRQIARTRVSERVRRIIADARAERAERRRIVAQRIVNRENFMDDVPPLPGPSRRGTKRKRTTKRKTTSKKRKTTRKKRATKKKTPGKKTRRKRKTKRKGQSKKKSPSSAVSTLPALARTAQTSATVKGRIADKLGLKPPPKGRSIPLQRASNTQSAPGGSGGSNRHEAAPSFSILGNKDELYSFAEYEGEERVPVHRPAIPASSLSRSALSSHRPLGLGSSRRSHINVTKQGDSSAMASTSQSSALNTPKTSNSEVKSAAPFDLLGSIMSNQDLLHKGSQHITIRRDGSLEAAPSSLEVHAASRNFKLGKSSSSNSIEDSNKSGDIASTGHSTSSREAQKSPTKISTLTNQQGNISSTTYSLSHGSVRLAHSSHADASDKEMLNRKQSLNQQHKDNLAISKQILSSDTLSAISSSDMNTLNVRLKSASSREKIDDPSYSTKGEHSTATTHCSNSGDTGEIQSCKGDPPRAQDIPTLALTTGLQKTHNAGDGSRDNEDMNLSLSHAADGNDHQGGHHSPSSHPDDYHSEGSSRRNRKGKGTAVSNPSINNNSSTTPDNISNLTSDSDNNSWVPNIATSQAGDCEDTHFIFKEEASKKAHDLSFGNGSDMMLRGEIHMTEAEENSTRLKEMEATKYKAKHSHHTVSRSNDEELHVLDEPKVTLKVGQEEDHLECSKVSPNEEVSSTYSEQGSKACIKPISIKQEMEGENLTTDGERTWEDDGREEGETCDENISIKQEMEGENLATDGERTWEDDGREEGETCAENISIKQEVEGENLLTDGERAWQDDGKEEGEASDSGEEGELRDDKEESMNFGDYEEGEIIDEEEKEKTDSVAKERLKNLPEDETQADEKDVKDENIRKSSPEPDTWASSFENLLSKEVEVKESNSSHLDKAETEAQVEDNVEEEIEEEEEEDSTDNEFDPEDKMIEAFTIGKLLDSLRTNQFDRRRDRAEKNDAIRKRKAEAAKRKELAELAAQNAKISILDFIGNASAKKFGVYAPPVVSKKADAPGTIRVDMPGRGRGRGAFDKDSGDAYRNREWNGEGNKDFKHKGGPPGHYINRKDRNDSGRNTLHGQYHSNYGGGRRRRSRSRSPTTSKSHRVAVRAKRHRSRSESPHISHNKSYSRRNEKPYKKRQSFKNEGYANSSESDKDITDEKGHKWKTQKHKKMRHVRHSPEMNGSESSNNGDGSNDSSSSEDDNEDGASDNGKATAETDSDDEVLAKRTSPVIIPQPAQSSSSISLDQPVSSVQPPSPPSPPAFSPVGPLSPSEPPPPPPSPPQQKRQKRASLQKEVDSQYQQQRHPQAHVKQQYPQQYQEQNAHDPTLTHPHHQPQHGYPQHPNYPYPHNQQPTTHHHPQQHPYPDHPGAHPQQHPGTQSQHHPGMHPQQHPGAHHQQHPGTHLQQNPEAHPQQHPGYPQQHPGTHPHPQSGPHPHQHPGPHPQQHPGPHPQQHPGPHSQHHPGPHPQLHPGPHPQQHPGPHPQQHPGAYPQHHPGTHPQHQGTHLQQPHEAHQQQQPMMRPQYNTGTQPHQNNPGTRHPYPHTYVSSAQHPHYMNRPAQPGQYGHQVSNPRAPSVTPRSSAPVHPAYQHLHTTGVRPAHNQPYPYQQALQHPGYMLPQTTTTAATSATTGYGYGQQATFQANHPTGANPGVRLAGYAGYPVSNTAGTKVAGFSQDPASVTSGYQQQHTLSTNNRPSSPTVSSSELSRRSRVSSYRISPSEPSFKGVASSDRIASNLLLDEVKKGFRTLVEDAVRSALKPAWSAKRVTKDEYKDIFKRAVDKVCGSKETVVQQDKIQLLVEAYVAKARKTRTS